MEEANRALAQVRPLVARIVELTARLPELQEEVRAAQYRAQRPAATAAERDRFEQARAGLREAEDRLLVAMQGLERMGVQLKDPRLGLVDFLSYRGRQLVELCWKLGEERVAHWHPIGKGYPGRRPI